MPKNGSIGVTERKRADQMRGANESFKEAESNMVAAQEKVLTLQEQMGILDPGVGIYGAFDTDKQF